MILWGPIPEHLSFYVCETVLISWTIKFLELIQQWCGHAWRFVHGGVGDHSHAIGWGLGKSTWFFRVILPSEFVVLQFLGVRDGLFCVVFNLFVCGWLFAPWYPRWFRAGPQSTRCFHLLLFLFLWLASLLLRFPLLLHEFNGSAGGRDGAWCAAHLVLAAALLGFHSINLIILIFQVLSSLNRVELIDVHLCATLILRVVGLVLAQLPQLLLIAGLWESSLLLRCLVVIVEDGLFIEDLDVVFLHILLILYLSLPLSTNLTIHDIAEVTLTLAHIILVTVGRLGTSVMVSKGSWHLDLVLHHRVITLLSIVFSGIKILNGDFVALGELDGAAGLGCFW